MTILGRTHAGSIAERAIALLRERGAALRGAEIADVLGVPQSSITPCLKPHVENGTLVTCLVLGKRGRETFEYRIGAGGKPMTFREYKPSRETKPPIAETKPAETRSQAAHGRKPDAAIKVQKSVSLAASVLAPASDPAGPILELTDSVPNPGPRFGKDEIYRNTLRAMKGDDSFTLKDATMVYPIAKKLGIKITTRQEGDHVRVWRVG